jgi:hypothetical protein
MNRLLAAMEREGSTRSVSLLRILMALICWSRWANEVQWYRTMRLDGLALCIAFFVSTTLMLVGWKSRWSTLAVGLVTVAMVHVVDPGRWYSHHTRAIELIVLGLVLTPCGRSYSLDRWLALRRAERTGTEPPAEIGPTWGRLSIGLVVGAIYLWSGLDKLDPAFVSGERIQHMVMHTYLGSTYPSSPLFPWLTMLSSWFVTATWIVMPVALFHPRLQRVFIPLGLFLHAVIYLTLPVGPFTVTMWASYLVFLDPDAFHRFVDRMHGYTPR